MGSGKRAEGSRGGESGVTHGDLRWRVDKNEVTLRICSKRVIKDVDAG